MSFPCLIRLPIFLFLPSLLTASHLISRARDDQTVSPVSAFSFLDLASDRILVAFFCQKGKNDVLSGRDFSFPSEQQIHEQKERASISLQPLCCCLSFSLRLK